MRRVASVRWVGLVAGLVWLGQAEMRGQAPAAAAVEKKICAVAALVAPSDADNALSRGKFEDAERMYAAMPVTPESTAGVVRSMLGERKLDEALALVEKENAAHPNDTFLLELLGEVRYRRGEVEETAIAYDRSQDLDPCSARTHYEMSRFMNLNGRYASAQGQLDLAHRLAPEDPTIKRAWESTQRVPETPEQAIARLKKRLDNGNLTDVQKTEIANSIKAIEARENGTCELAAPITTAKIPMWATNSSNNTSHPPTNSRVDVMLNGKRLRFVVNTGASGLLLSKDAAKALGLTPEAEIKTSDFGDKGSQGTYLAHVDSVKIGSMEFRNCMVRVLETDTVNWTDGLLGPDMFRSFLVTLDFPASEMRLSPLPKRPDEAEAAVTLGTSGDEENDASGQTIAQRKKDRYVAPEMQDWQRIYRSGPLLIVPTTIGNVPKKLFIMATGSGLNLISIQSAKEVTKVFSGTGLKMKGPSGAETKVEGTDGLSIQFARVRQVIREGVYAIDMASSSRSAGVEISGFIGYPILHQLVFQIDYRDNLVKVTYTPHKEFIVQ